MIVAFLTRNAPTLKQLNIMGIVHRNLDRRFYRKELEIVYHEICSCKALACRGNEISVNLTIKPKYLNANSLIGLYLLDKDQALGCSAHQS